MKSIKHVLASQKDKKPTILKSEMFKIIGNSNQEKVCLYYEQKDEIVVYKKSRNGSTFYPLTSWPKKLELPKISEPIYYMVKQLFEYDESNKEKENVFNSIRDWAKEKGIYEKGDTKTQFIKLQEETGELAKSILKNDKEEFIDAIGDCVVVLTNLAELGGVKIEDCIVSAYNVIKSRKGKMINGTFAKNN